MKKKEKNFYITTPIYYVNDVPHIGHAYTTVICDTIANFNKWLGNEVNFLTGTDEHGQKVEKSALKANMDPQTFTDNVSTSFKKLASKLEINKTDFIRTTEERQIKTLKQPSPNWFPRHKKKLPVRGQRTHSNARTRKGKAIAIAGKKLTPIKK